MDCLPWAMMRRNAPMAVAPILSWEGLSLIQGSGWLFRDLDIFIGPRDRLALIGRNGAGKTTLLRLIAGTLDADKGNRSIQPGTKVVVLNRTLISATALACSTIAWRRRPAPA
jgi:ATPase subunit of ABC transporter with duplicated ATPase domains